MTFLRYFSVIVLGLVLHLIFQSPVWSLGWWTEAIVAAVIGILAVQVFEDWRATHAKKNRE